MNRFYERIRKTFGLKREPEIIKEIPFFTKDIFIGNNVEIGDYTYGMPKVLQWGENANLRIGKFCSIAEEVKIFLGGNHRMDWVTTYPFNSIDHFINEGKDIKGHPHSKGDVVIGNDVWIGWGAVIMSGVNIGTGAVVGAYAIVTKDVAPYEVVAGNPAKHIRYRFDATRIKQLLELGWWNFAEDEIRKIIPLLNSNNFEKLFNR